MFSLLKIWAAWPYMLSVSLVRCKNEALRNMYFKSIIKCFKRVKIDKWPDSPYSFPPIDCCVRINGEPDRLFRWVIFSHRFLDSDCINFKNFCIPGCLLTLQNIIIQHRRQSSTIFLNRSSTMLNNVFKACQVSLLWHNSFLVSLWTFQPTLVQRCPWIGITQGLLLFCSHIFM